MPTTKDYALVGKTVWRATIYLDDGCDAFSQQLDSATRPNRGLIKAWVNATLPRFHQVPAGQTGRPWAQAERGTYQDTSFDDGEFGYVRDASWEPDGGEMWASLAEDGVTVNWDVDS